MLQVKTAYLAALQKVHKKGFNRIVGVVAEGNFVAACGLCGIVENAASHSGAHTAGVALFSYLKYYLVKLGGSYNRFDVKPAAKLDYLGIIGGLSEKAGINHNCFQGKFFSDKIFSVLREPPKGKGNPCLPTLHRNAVAFVDHTVFVDCLADNA